VTHAGTLWGQSIVLEWPVGFVDRFVRNLENDTIRFGDITTDARILLLRTRDRETGAYLAADATYLGVGGRSLLSAEDPVGVTKNDNRITIDRADTSFRIYAPTAVSVTCRGEAVPVRRDGPYLVSIDRIATPGRRVAVDAFPNPFNASVTVVVDILEAAETGVAVYDVAGRAVRALWNGQLPAGPSPFVWDGRDDRAQPVASGVYFVRARSSGVESVEKLVLVK
jgi:hypothetical protein